MEVIFGIKKIKKYRKPVVALGVFDGLHRGHIDILKGTVRKARSIKGTSVVLTFWPHPQRQESLYSLEHRLRLIGKLGIDVCIVINFNKRFTRITAADFVKDILFKKIHAHYVYVGKNFRFGRNAEGDFKTLKKLAQTYDFKLKLFKVLKINKKAISSTYIRNLVKKGELNLAEKLLTRPVSILGTVIKGSLWARRLGFPTANINPHHEVIPPPGVYAAKIIFKDKKFSGVCYIGTDPTLKLQRPLHVEVHIFNFKNNIYGKDLEVLFMEKIREERRFTSEAALVTQIKKDMTFTKSLFSLH
jgi:riboflavin kinase/FMN adenylyltransferase